MSDRVGRSKAERCQSLIDYEIGRRLRSRREMLGLTQLELAERCRISPQQCHKYETGASSMRAPRLVDFAEALGVPLSYFFNGLERVNDYPDDLLELFSDRMNAELIRVYSQIAEPSIRHGILEIARAAERAQVAAGLPSRQSIQLASTVRRG